MEVRLRRVRWVGMDGQCDSNQNRQSVVVKNEGIKIMWILSVIDKERARVIRHAGFYIVV